MSSIGSENQENTSHMRRRKPDLSRPFNVKANATHDNKRTILGTLSSNVRVQPKRAAKQTGGSEKSTENASNWQKTISNPPKDLLTLPRTNIFTFGSSSNDRAQNFTIYADPPVVPAVKRSDQNRNSTFPLSHSQIALEKENCSFPQTLLNLPQNSHSQISKSENSVVVAAPVPTVSPVALKEDILKLREVQFWDVLEYRDDIYYHQRTCEMHNKPKPNYMQKQTDITSSMRWILIDWLVEVAEEYNLSSECLHLAVSYVDRFLSHMSVKRDKLQLVGTTAMFIASKYEEIYPPEIAQFAYITDNSYRVGQILRMEHLILKVLNFDMSSPTILTFVNHFTRVYKISEETAHLAQFLSELSMLEADTFLKYVPSVIAAAAIALANYTQGSEAWPQQLADSTRYSLNTLKDCYLDLHASFVKAHGPRSHSISEKYKASKYHNVANLSPREGVPW